MVLGNVLVGRNWVLTAFWSLTSANLSFDGFSAKAPPTLCFA
jgi:hypothetical protein